MAMKLYGLTLSPNVTRVLVCLEEVGAEYELLPVNLPGGEHKQPHFLAKNPFGQIPAFEDGDLALFESRAIAKYIFRKYNSDLLIQPNLTSSAMVDLWVEVESNQYNPAISPITYQCLIVPMRGGAPDQSIIDASLEKFKKVLEVYEARLGKTKCLAGDFVSFADLSHFPSTYNFSLTPYFKVIDEFPRVKAWWEDLLARPAIKKVVEIIKQESK